MVNAPSGVISVDISEALTVVREVDREIADITGDMRHLLDRLDKALRRLTCLPIDTILDSGDDRG